MKRKLKAILALILAIVTLFSLAALPTSATEAEQRNGITFDRTVIAVEAKSYSYAKGHYYSHKHFNDLPATFEAWINIPSSAYASSGVLFGNFTGYDRDVSLNFEITQHGVPKLVYYTDHGTQREVVFTEATIPADAWTHLSIVYGTGKNSRQIFCYINGEKVQDTFASDWFVINDSFADNKFCLGGDFRAMNSAHFRGTLGDVSIYADARSDEEIRSDMIAPDTQDPDLLAYYKLSEAEKEKDIPDLSGNGYDMKYYPMWLTEKDMNEIRKQDEHKYAYSIAFIPDTQYTTQFFSEKLHYTYDWLVANAQKRNIKYVVSLGDMTNSNTEQEWNTVKAQTDKMNGVVPYSVVRGNHDITFNGQALLFNQYYGDPTGFYYNHVMENGGSFSDQHVYNTYLLFSAGDVDYLLLNLDFGAGDTVLEWADNVVREHSDRRVIIATHGYLHYDGLRLGKGDPASPSHYNSAWSDANHMWDTFISKHENIAMVVCGHVHSDKIITSKAIGKEGNTVHQILIDSQTADSRMNGLGLVAMFYFTQDGQHARVEYYSTVFDRYFRGDNALITLDFPSVAKEEEPPVQTPSVDAPDSKAPTDAIVISCAYAVAVTVLAAVIFIIVKKRKTK